MQPNHSLSLCSLAVILTVKTPTPAVRNIYNESVCLCQTEYISPLYRRLAPANIGKVPQKATIRVESEIVNAYKSHTDSLTNVHTCVCVFVHVNNLK